ncbi:MAG: S-layer homology domain-containing protein, partial [Acidimicrobiia bacterium]
EDRFCPDDTVDRAQMAAFLARALGLSPPSGDFFTDDDGSLHEPAINSVAAHGITVGCGSAEYCPDEVVTRGQMAALLRRAVLHADEDAPVTLRP